MTTDNSIIRYGSFDESVLDEQSAQVNDLSGQMFIKPEVGENVYRFLPPPIGRRNSPFRITAMHYVEAIPGLEKQLVFACPRHELKVACVVCQKAEELTRSPNPLDRDRAKDLQARLSIYSNVVNRRSPEPVVKVLRFGKQVWDQLKNIRKNPRLGGDFTDPTAKGFDIILIRTGTGKNDTEYTVSADRVNTPLHQDPAVIQLLIDSQPDLDSLVDPVVPEQLRAIWGGMMGVPAHQAGPVPGGSTMPSRWAPPPLPSASAAPPIQTAGRAVKDAQQVIEYDEDYNPIVRNP